MRTTSPFWQSGYDMRFAAVLLLSLAFCGCSRDAGEVVSPIRTAADLKGRHVAHMSSDFHRRELEALVRNNATSMFVTVFVGVLDLGTGELSYGCAGHNPPVIIPPDGQARLLEVKRQPPTGAVEGTAYAVQTAQIEKGSKIVVYTDGVTEAERADHGQFGDGRLLHFAEGCAEASVSDTAVGLLKAVDEFVDGAEQSDDIAILSIGV